jgi:ribosome maturation factor RimP
MAASAGVIRAGIEPLVVAAGAELDELQIQSAGRREIVRVVVDRDGGVDLDLVSEVSRAISAALDAEPLNSQFAGTFVLEVTSPGVDRPLTEIKHWRRSIDRLVEATLADGTSVTGRIVAVDADHVVLEVQSGKVLERRTVAHADLVRGLVQVEFNRAAPEADLPELLTTDDEGADDGH